MSIFPDAQFVYIQREPVATIRSWMEIHWSENITGQLWWHGAYSKEELQKANELSSNQFLFAAFQYRKLMQTTQQEIEKMHPDIYIGHYEDFVDDPNKFIARMLEYLDLSPSPLLDKFMKKLLITDRNQRKASSPKTEMSENTKKSIIEIVNS